MNEEMSKYWINEWAIVRRNEMAYLPAYFDIHPDFLKTLEKEAFETTFRFIGDLFYRIYTDIAAEPEKFGMPLYSPDQYHYGSKQAGDSRAAAWSVFYLLLYMFCSGEIKNGRFMVDGERFRGVNTVKNMHIKIEALCDYGFIFHGLKNYKLPKTTDSFEIEYPDNPGVLAVMHLVAIKIKNTQLINNSSNDPKHFENAFISWNCRALKDDLRIMDYKIKDVVLDKVKNEADRNFTDAFHSSMLQKGFVYGRVGWNEGPGICYYNKQSVMDRKGPYLYRVQLWKSDLQLMMRIRNAEKCMNYLQNCPESIREMFRRSDDGCGHRDNGCGMGIRYTFEGKERWKCGCCKAAFITHPIEEDIPHYIKLVEIGEKK